VSTRRPEVTIALNVRMFDMVEDRAAGRSGPQAPGHRGRHDVSAGRSRPDGGRAKIVSQNHREA
jgi:hypothetical protein